MTSSLLEAPLSFWHSSRTSPYPGLRTFQWQEADLFFGREKQAQQLIENLSRNRFLTVMGPSGCGKSSLVRAGMVAQLYAGFMAEAQPKWIIADMQPRERPLGNLTEALLRTSVWGARREGDVNAAGLIQATLQSCPGGLSKVLTDTPLPAGTNLLILVDQFEEIFRFRRKGNAREADAFIAALLEAVEQSEHPIYVVATMRSDYLGDCALFDGLPEIISQGSFIIPRLTRKECESAIVGPARVFDAEIDPVLVNTLLNDLGPDSNQLPLLQHALMRMWNAAVSRTQDRDGMPAKQDEYEEFDNSNRVYITGDDYHEIGELNEALCRHADEIYRSLNTHQKYIAQTIFRRLTEREVRLGEKEYRDTRRYGMVADIAAVAGCEPLHVIEVADAFRRSDRSMLTPVLYQNALPEESSASETLGERFQNPLTQDSTLDISHECLIREWDRLTRWVEREAASAAIYSFLVQQARQHQREPDLLRPPALKRALTWQREQHPNLAWAERYGSHQDFELVEQFLTESAQSWAREEKTTKSAQEREFANARRTHQAKIIFLGALVTAILVGAGIGGGLVYSQEIVKTAIARSEAAQEEAKTKVDAANGELESVNAELTSAQGKENAAHAKVIQVKAQIDAAKSQVKKANFSAAEAMRKSKEMQQTTLVAVRKANQELKAAHDKVITARAESKRAVQDAIDRREEVESVQKSLIEQRNILIAETKTVGTLKKERKNLQAGLQTTRVWLTNAKNNLDQTQRDYEYLRYRTRLMRQETTNNLHTTKSFGLVEIGERSATRRAGSVINSAAELKLTDKMRPLRPGIRITVDSQGSSGTATFGGILRDGTGQRYLLCLSGIISPRFSDENRDALIFQPAPGEDASESQAIATVARAGSAASLNNVAGFLLAKIKPGVEIDSAIPGISAPVRLADANDRDKLDKGDAIQLIGPTSGHVKGTVLRKDVNGFATARISAPGDAGAPVLTMDGKLIGLVSSHSPDGTETNVLFLQPLLTKLQKTDLTFVLK